MKIFLLLILTLLFISCSANKTKPLSSEQDLKCLSYEPEKVRLGGFLFKKSFPGPPNYEDIKKGDEEEVYWLVKTHTPFCVNENSDWDKVSNQTEVQLVLNKFDFYQKRKSLLNKNVTISGTLFPQHTGHHKTEILITVENLERVGE